MLHYRLRHLFVPALLSFVEPSDFSEAAASAGAVLNTGLCAKGDTCLHLSNNEAEPVEARQCELTVRDFARAEARLSVNFTASAPAVGGAVVATFPTADLLQRAGCGAGECWLSAQCGTCESCAAQPQFPTPLADCALQPAEVTISALSVDGDTVRFRAEANTTAPFTFFSSELPGTFSDNSMTLRPGAALTLEFRASGAAGASGISEGAFRRATRVYTMNNLEPQRL